MKRLVLKDLLRAIARILCLCGAQHSGTACAARTFGPIRVAMGIKGKGLS